MTNFEVRVHPEASRVFASLLDETLLKVTHPEVYNWPVVYILDDAKQIYIGETRSAYSRIRQHLSNPDKRHLRRLHLVIDQTFNKSATLDLESMLIRLFAGDNQFEVLNRNEGIVDSNYFDRENYLKKFDEIFEDLRAKKLFQRSIAEIQNRDMFKLSPFKALNTDQAVIGSHLVQLFLDDIAHSQRGESVVRGSAGTGKTVLAIYLLKLLRDIEKMHPDIELDKDTVFSEFFTRENQALLRGTRLGLVIPQQSLRDTVQRVFKSTSGLDKAMVLSPFDVAESAHDFDLLIVDEAHRLNQRANQSSGVMNRKFIDLNILLFGRDDDEITQLDWIRKKSQNAIFLLDTGQTVRPADIGESTVQDLIESGRDKNRYFELATQMRVKAGSDYLGYVRSLLAQTVSQSIPDFGEYEFYLFTDLKEMYQAVLQREKQFELSRLVAGYAWEWISKKETSAFDIEEDGLRLRWNSTAKDWISSPNSISEVGSIHTVQGYDLNYAGVIVGRDLRLDPSSGEIFFDRSNYFDVKGKEDNRRRKISYSDEDILAYVKNIYSVLMTRGIRGTFVYVCDEPLRQYLMKHIPVWGR